MIVEKEWGSEELINLTDFNAVKILKIKEGKKTSKHYHKVKKEYYIVIKGMCIVELNDDTIVLIEKDKLDINPKDIHRIYAIEDTEIMEVSTPELDDVVRL